MPTVILPTIVRRAAIAGYVSDGVTRRRLPGVSVTVQAMPAAFEAWLGVRALQHGAAWDGLAERPDRTVTAGDGGFRFVDLPDGAYTLSFEHPGGARRYGVITADFTVARDGQGNIAVVIAPVTLPPTGVGGQVQVGGSASPPALPLARVRVDGGDEAGYVDAAGRFYLTGVETGARRLLVSAAGFAPTTAPVTVVAGKVADAGTIVINPLDPGPA